MEPRLWKLILDGFRHLQMAKRSEWPLLVGPGRDSLVWVGNSWKTWFNSLYVKRLWIPQESEETKSIRLRCTGTKNKSYCSWEPKARKEDKWPKPSVLLTVPRFRGPFWTKLWPIIKEPKLGKHSLWTANKFSQMFFHHILPHTQALWVSTVQKKQESGHYG